MKKIIESLKKESAFEDFRTEMKKLNKKITTSHLKQIAKKFGFTSAWVSLMFGLIPVDEKKISKGDKIATPDNRHKTIKY